MHPLDGIRAKVERGEEHIQTLNREVERFFLDREHGPIGVRHQIDPKNKTWSVVIAHVDTVPTHVGTIVGDVAHNFRSALDQLVFELAFIDTRGTEVETSAFPASRTINNFRSNWVQNRMLRGLTLRHRAMVKRFQPYRVRQIPGRHHLLSFLDDLSNDDKHRLTQPVLIAPEGVSFEFPPGYQGHNCHIPKGDFFIRNVIGWPLQEETELLRVPIVVTGPGPEMPVETELRATIGFRDGTPAQDALEAIAFFVREVVMAFATEFERPVAKRFRDTSRFGRIQPVSAEAEASLHIAGDDGTFVSHDAPLTVAATSRTKPVWTITRRA